MQSLKHLLRLDTKRKKIIAIGAATLALLVVASIVIPLLLQRSDTETVNQPPFSALLPSNKKIADLGGWKKLAPPNSDPSYVFSDAIGAISISVSQQTLPESFTANPGQSTTELAKAYNATDELEVNGTKVYIGTSAKGPQSVIFTKNNLLVLIKSQAVISNDAWETYIKSLE